MGKRKYGKHLQRLEEQKDRKFSSKLAYENLKEIDKPRKPIHLSFIAKFDGDECPLCFQQILKDQKIRYRADDTIVHARHRQEESKQEICNSCFLTLPCECE